jgi:putative transposase
VREKNILINKTTSLRYIRMALKIKRRYLMSNFNKLAHSIWECKYHLVWCPKYRFRILVGEVGKTAIEIIRELCSWKKLEIIEGSVQKDHIHLILSVPLKYSISEVVGFIKGKSAIKMFDRHRSLKNRYWGRHFWAKGYCVSTIGLDEDQIKKYVKWQLEKDRKMEQLKLWKY